MLPFKEKPSLRKFLQATNQFSRATSTRVALIGMLAFGGLWLSGLTAIGMLTGKLIKDQSDQTIMAEVEVLESANRLRGSEGFKQIISDRSAYADTESLYFLSDRDGAVVAGNLQAWPEDGRREGDWLNFTYEVRRKDMVVRRAARARIFDLSGGGRLLVGRDIEQTLTVASTIKTLTFGIGGVILLIALFTGLAAARFFFDQLDAINRTSREIIAGDLSRRIAVSNRNDEFDQVAENLNRMLDQIQRLMNAMREVTDNVAHDLRSPLTRMRSRMEVTLMKPGTVEDYKSALEATIVDANHLLNTFNALLSIARVEAGSSRDVETRVDVCEVVQDIAELYEALAEDEGMTFEFRSDVDSAMLRGRRELVSQALANLMDNAIKYAPSPAGIRLTLTRSPGRAGSIDLAVSDSGPGIPASERKRVLDRFVRLEASRNSPGSGLGLSLVNAVAQFHGGKFLLEDSELMSEDGTPGLKATLRLPLVSAPAETVRSAA